jgi:hypothetical protein
MTITVYSYTIYHSPNAYLGTVLLRRAIIGLPDVQLVRRPICVPRVRGLMIAEMLRGKENRNVGSYLREDCRRWADRFTISFVYPDPESSTSAPSAGYSPPMIARNCRPAPFTRPIPKDATCSIRLCSKPPGSRGSTSTSLKPFGGPYSARASTPTI